MSAYDTAWVARVPALDGSPGPQFPKSLQWIVDHQLPDGDWGEPALFLVFDRTCSTLACIIALQIWGVGAQSVERGKQQDFISFSQINVLNKGATKLTPSKTPVLAMILAVFLEIDSHWLI